MRLNIVLPSKVATRCMEEICEALVYGARDLGHEAEGSVDFKTHVQNVVLTPFAYVDAGIAMPPGTILYNLEQVELGSRYFQPQHLEAMRLYRVWDYDRENIRKLAGAGVVAEHCPVGSHPALFRMVQNVEEDLDVVFAGAVNERRQKILAAIRDLGVRVEALAHVYGEERDAIYQRAKVVLNVHFFETKIFESVRVSYLLQNRRCVLTETSLGGGDAPFAEAMATTYYEDLPRLAASLVRDAEARENLKKKTLAVMGRLPMSASLEPLLGRGRTLPPKHAALRAELLRAKRTLLVGDDALAEASPFLDEMPRESAVVALTERGKEHWSELVQRGTEKLPVYGRVALLSSLAGAFDLVVSPLRQGLPLGPGTTWISDDFEAALAAAPPRAPVSFHEDKAIVRVPGGAREAVKGKALGRRPKPWHEGSLYGAEVPPFPEAETLFRWALSDRYGEMDRGPLLSRITDEAEGAQIVADLGTGQGATLRALLLAKPRHALVCDWAVPPSLSAMAERAPWCHLEYVPGDLREHAPLPRVDVLLIDTRLTCQDIYPLLERHAPSARKVLILGTRRYDVRGEDHVSAGVWHAVSGFCTAHGWRVLFRDPSGIGLSGISR